MGNGKQNKENAPVKGIVPDNAPQNQAELSAQSLAEPLQDALSYPCMYQVIMLNDDFTPMDFVTEILERVFYLPPLEARSRMLQVHHDGQAVCGIYTHDVAETKVIQVMDTATQYNYPLKCIMRKETRYAIKKS